MRDFLGARRTLAPATRREHEVASARTVDRGVHRLLRRAGGDSQARDTR
jgi:hypothetical protein